ncbi:MAG: sigma-70 family RNA polymerase sigma factor [Sphingomonadaceae bacterium]
MPEVLDFRHASGSTFRHDKTGGAHYRASHVPRLLIARMTDLSGLEAVFEANRMALRRFLRARLRNDDDANDVLQDLWIKIRALDAGPISEPLAYIYRMADNLVLDMKRAGGRRAARETAWAEGQMAGTPAAPADASPSAERTLIARDYLRRVETRIDALPERTAYAFRAVRIEGRPQKDIAAELGISLSAVEKHLQRAYREIVIVHDELNADSEGAHRHSVKGMTDDG